MEYIEDPILASKLYGISSYIVGVSVVFIVIFKKFGSRTAITSIAYLMFISLLYAQVSFRNQSDSMVFLGTSLAVSSALLPSNWLSILLLSLGSGLAINAKFHSLGYILPLAAIIYKQHGIPRLVLAATITVLVIVFPYYFDGVSFQNFIQSIGAYSNLPLNMKMFRHNLAMVFVLVFPILVLFYFNIVKTGKYNYKTESIITPILTFSMCFLVALTGSIDGAGFYHLAPFAPAFSVLYAIYYSRTCDSQRDILLAQPTVIKTAFAAAFIAWFLTMFTYGYSTQKKYIHFVTENYSNDIKNEVIEIRDFLANKNYEVIMGYSDRNGYDYTYYRPILWQITKTNVLDPVALMGRQFVGINIPDEAIKRFADQYYDIVILPNTGKPFSMKNWHNYDLSVFEDKLPEVFSQNYHVCKKYKYFVLWCSNNKLPGNI